MASRWYHRAAGVLACLAMTVVAAPGRGLEANVAEAPGEEAPATVRLEWNGVGSYPSCLSAEALRASVERILERRVFVAAAPADVTLRGEVTGSAGVWSARLSLVDADGSELGVRELEKDGEDCTVLDGPIAVVAALLVDFRRKHIRLSLGRAESPRQNAARPLPWAFGAGGSALFAWGLLPGAALGTAVRLTTVPPRFAPVVAEAVVFPDRSTSSGVFSAWYAGVSLCPPLLGKDPLVLSGCLGARGGAVRGEAVGVPIVFEVSKGYVHVEAGADLRARIAGPLAVQLGAGAMAPVTRDSFYVTEGRQNRTVHTTAMVIPWASLGVGVTFL